LPVLGVVLGLIGLYKEKDRKKLFAKLGLALNGAVCLLWMGWLVLLCLAAART